MTCTFVFILRFQFQGSGLQRSLPILHDTINRITNDFNGLPLCFKIANLGCSSGPNTFFVVTNIIDRVHDICLENNCQVPQFQVILNDLFENEFNTVFRLKPLPAFHSKLKEGKGNKCGSCFVSAIPGSFYGGLFPNESIHLFHSSYAIHWLSQVPQGLKNNKLNICMAKTSPTNVFEAYRKQFDKDFTKFLAMRSQETVSGGRMILTLAGRSITDPTSKDCCAIWELLAKSLDMIKEWPTPGINTAYFIRAIIEPMMAAHFGNTIMDVLFEKYQEHVVDHLATNKGMNYNLVISLIKR
ncbi:benzoate carboxyl methyltransferase-like [Bidens hawaiensis]|uniref:benzoate carboxyl methyltransferase-like n=1 Tax=Bidens hawaiensis TaxID=980011 RepID=UPI00404B6819